ncbi:MAG: cytochrome c oxidase subunit II [Burkholderiales bacterium]|nr:cytochrome c oxidase subunit II [Burkholderiales bacterium]
MKRLDTSITNALLVVCCCLPLSACSGIQSVFNPHGPNARHTAQIGWVMFIGGALIFLVVAAFAVYAVLRKPAKRGWISHRGFIIGGGIVFPLITLTALLIYDFRAARAIVAGLASPALTIEVVGEQWWWRVRYLGGSDVDESVVVDADAADKGIVISANEIHIPAGRSVTFALKSADVIHSFWVPNLAGKLDMIPGRTTKLRMQADHAGVFRGQCAEYCGGPHAKMAFYVVAHEPEEFERWLAHERTPAQPPGTRFLAEGQRLFLETSCAVCHQIRGTAARGQVGPDLTHVGNRLSIGAGILPNNTGTLAGWIASSQHLKPGNRMPSFDAFTGEELRALAAYLESLK